MAKLSPKDPQFGIPIACRAPKHLAHALNLEAQKKGATLSRHVSDILSNSVSDKRKAEYLQGKIEKQNSIMQRALARFIAEVGRNGNQKQLAETFNKILEDEKRK